MFSRKVVAITGAGSGIGRALAIEFARHGARLALADVNGVALAKTLEGLPQETEARIYQVDVSDREAVFKFAEDVVADFGSIHTVINNAGIGVIASVEHITYEELERVININLWGVIHGTKAFLPKLLAQREGCVVNVSSVFGLLATPCQAAYVMAKFAVRGLTETLWQELEGTGVSAVLVHPGGINTNISQNSPVAASGTDYEQKLSKALLGQMTTTPQACAKEIVEGLVRGDKRLLVGSGAKTLHRISRLFPQGYGALLKRKLAI